MNVHTRTTRNREKLASWGPHRELLEFACALDIAGEIPTLNNMLLFFEKPWYWRAEFEAWETHGKPTGPDSEGWGEFVDALGELP